MHISHDLFATGLKLEVATMHIYYAAYSTRSFFICLYDANNKYLLFSASSFKALAKSVLTNCVHTSNSGKQWSTRRYSIHDANPSFSHKCVHHSCHWMSKKQSEDVHSNLNNLANPCQLNGTQQLRGSAKSVSSWG